MAVIDDLLTGMLEEKGSDLHIMVGEPARIRVHGELAPLEMERLGVETVEYLMQEICSPELWEQFLTTGDADFAYAIDGLARFRCNYFLDYRGPGAILRTIPAEIASMEDLRLPQVLHTFCEIREGLVLVTGPTGSGKSTTLAAMIDYINRTHRRKIITVEDPIEFMHTNQESIIVHREIGEHSRSFANALRSAMQADPDIVLLGEMRDLETIKLALDCAAMGILVFGTLHTNSAPKTIDRIIDAFPAGEQPQIRMTLADCLAGVVSQLLCKSSDNRGRVAIHEILLRTEGLPNVIREGQISSIRTIIESGRSEGMICMDDSLEQFLHKDEIRARDAYMLAFNKKRFAEYMQAEENAIEEEEHRPIATGRLKPTRGMH